MTRRAYLYFSLTFLLGLLIGAWGMYSYARYSGRWHWKFSQERIIHRLQRELSLSDQQVQQLTAIMDESAKKYADLESEVEPQFAALREERRNRIRQILGPEQLVKFNELVRRSNQRARKHPAH